MKINIKPEKCKFIVDEKKRKVICILEGTSTYLLNFIDYPFDCNFYIWPNREKLLEMPNRFVGVATCSPEDNWDVEIGKAIAFSRMKHKINVSFFKRAQKLVNILNEDLTGVVEKFNEYGKLLDKNQTKRLKWISDKTGCELTFN